MNKKKYCDFCWAKLYGGGCHIVDLSVRMVHCQKAKERSESAVEKNQTQRLRDYIAYLSNRIRYLKLFQGSVEFNEYKYYCELRSRIKDWGKDHIVPYAYLCGKIGLQKAMELYGVSERDFYKLIKLQRARLIKFIEDQEEALEQKYPFIPMSDMFCKE